MAAHHATAAGRRQQFWKTIYDDGVEFSGGEIQKLLLARALYKSAPILLLDEPTAALDPLAESWFYEKYHQISAGKTSVFISHRLASTSFCDRILLIENGVVCEEGTHAQLIARKGKYYSLFETQAAYYREEGEQGGANANEKMSLRRRFEVTVRVFGYCASTVRDLHRAGRCASWSARYSRLQRYGFLRRLSMNYQRCAE